MQKTFIRGHDRRKQVLSGILAAIALSVLLSGCQQAITGVKKNEIEYAAEGENIDSSFYDSPYTYGEKYHICGIHNGSQKSSENNFFSI